MRALLALLMTAALGSGCALSAEGELPEIEIVQRDIVIPGLPAEVRTIDPMITLPVFLRPREQLGLPPEAFKSVKVKNVIVSLKAGGGGNLSFIRSLRLSLSGFQGFMSGVASTEVAHYERPANGPSAAVISAGQKSPVEVGDAWRDPITVLTVEAGGELPEESWTVDVTVRVSAVLTLE